MKDSEEIERKKQQHEVYIEIVKKNHLIDQTGFMSGPAVVNAYLNRLSTYSEQDITMGLIKCLLHNTEPDMLMKHLDSFKRQVFMAGALYAIENPKVKCFFRDSSESFKDVSKKELDELRIKEMSKISRGFENE